MKLTFRCVLIVLMCVAVLGCGSRTASESAGTNVATSDLPIYEAIRDGDLSEVKSILANDPGALNRPDGTFGETPLHQAAAADQVEIARYLIESGADVNGMDGRSVTPLTSAMDAEASEEMIELLKEHGADD